MFDTETYLARLGHTGPVQADLQTLRELHRKHMINIPFDNSLNAQRGAYIWDFVDIDVDATFDAVVTGGRGGVCFELGGLFQRLLEELGFDVDLLSAGVRGPDGEFGPDLEHLFHCVHLDGQVWLVDVGLSGPSFTEPLLVSDEVQTQFGVEYRTVAEGGYRVLQRKPPAAADWQDVYRFSLEPRKLSEWSRDASGQANADAEPGEGSELEKYGTALLSSLVNNGTVMHSRAFETGQMMLVGRRFLKVDNGQEKVRVLIDPVEYAAVVKDILHQDA